MSKQWIPVNENGQLWRYEEYVQDGNSYICVSGYAVVLNNKHFTTDSSFEYSQREVFFDHNSGEINGHREIIYLV